VSRPTPRCYCAGSPTGPPSNPPPGDGPVAYVRTRTGQTDILVEEGEELPDIRYFAGRELWSAPDDVRREVYVPDGAAPETTDTPPGTGHLFLPLPTDPAGLERQVREGFSPRDDGRPRSTGTWFEDLTRRWRFGVVDPAVQATYLRVLATKVDVTVAGAVTDRVGRPGVAVTARTDGDEPSDLTLIFDPDTGAHLGEEDLSRAPTTWWRRVHRLAGDGEGRRDRRPPLTVREERGRRYRSPR
jgi:hypothetical protein